MERHQLYQGRIISDPAVMLGKPVITGTRITVELILELLSGGATVDDILNEYPHLKREDINAALAFAADTQHNGWPLIFVLSALSRSAATAARPSTEHHTGLI